MNIPFRENRRRRLREREEDQREAYLEEVRRAEILRKEEETRQLLEDEKLKKLEADQKDRWQRGSPPKGHSSPVLGKFTKAELNLNLNLNHSRVKLPRSETSLNLKGRLPTLKYIPVPDKDNTKSSRETTRGYGKSIKTHG